MEQHPNTWINLTNISKKQKRLNRERNKSLLPNGFHRNIYSARLDPSTVNEDEIFGLGEITDIAAYREWLEQHLGQPELIIRDILRSCQHAYTRRFQICFEFAGEHNVMEKLRQRQQEEGGQKIIQAETGIEALLGSALSQGSDDIVRYLIDTIGVGVVMTPHVNQPYVGATALHLAILNNQRSLIQEMMSTMSLAQREHILRQEASGEFFDGTKGINGLPLSLALICGHRDIFLDLVQLGGNVALCDERMGNSPLHALVHFGVKEPQLAAEIMENILTNASLLAWYRNAYPSEVVGVDQLDFNLMKEYLAKLVNKEGFTALTLSARLRVFPILQYLLNTEGVYKFTLWRMGAVYCCYYDMSEIDPSVVYIENPGRPSVLELLVYCNSDDEIPVLANEPIRSLLRSKWKTYRVGYYVWAVYHLFVLAFSAVLAALAQDLGCQSTTDNTTMTTAETSSEKCDLETLYSVGKWLVNGITTVYLVVCLADFYHVVHLLVQGRVRWPKSGHYRTPWPLVWRFDQFDIVMYLYLVANIYWLSCSVEQKHDCAAIPRAMSHVLGWYFLLFFARTIRSTSYFTHMLGRVLVTDMIRFGLTIFILMLGFGFGLMVLFADNIPDEFYGIIAALSTMLTLTLGLSDISFTYGQRYSVLATLFTLTFIVFSTVLLLNMFIAAITDAYRSITESRQTLFERMLIRAVLVIERRIQWVNLRHRLSRVLVYEPTSAKWYLPVTRGIIGTDS